MGVGGLGIQGILDRLVAKSVGGVFNGTAGFVTGLGRGFSNSAPDAYNKVGIGKITSMLGHGIGSLASYPLRALGYSGYGVGHSLYNSLPKDWAYLKKVGYGLYKNTTKEIPQDLVDKGYAGLGGRIVNKPTAWALGVGAIGLGVMDGSKNSDYNIGIKYAVNGIMDTEGVSVTPGSVFDSYTPVYDRGRRKNNGLRDLGTDGSLGFALHNQRNSGQIRR